MKHILTILAFFSSLTALADGEPEQYICVAEATTGFEYASDNWQLSNFGDWKAGWLLNRHTPGDDYKGAWRLWKPMVDGTETLSICEDDFDELGLYCWGRSDFSLKRDTLEFAFANGTRSIVLAHPGGGDGLWAVYVSHGKCVPTSDQIPPWPRSIKIDDGIYERVEAFNEMIEELYEEMYGSKEEGVPPIKPKTKESN